jgi:hypothetical protein
MNTPFDFETSIYRCEEGTDNEEEFDVKVSGVIYPGEPRSFHCPGSDAMAEIHEVLRDGVDVYDSLSEEEMRELEEKAFEHAHDRAIEAHAAAVDHAIDLWKEEGIRTHVPSFRPDF